MQATPGSIRLSAESPGEFWFPGVPVASKPVEENCVVPIGDGSSE